MVKKGITIEQLKKALKALNLPQNGNKDALLERLGWAELNLIESGIFETPSIQQLNPNEDYEEWGLLKHTSGPVYSRIPKNC